MDPATQTKCRHHEDDITLTDGSVVLPDGISTVRLVLYIQGSKERILLSGVRYCSKLETKLIPLGMLDQKGLSYSSHKGILKVKDKVVPIMIGHPTPHNLYKVSFDISVNGFQIIHSRAMTAGKSKLVACLSIWHRRFAHLNEASIKHLVDITSGMLITPSFSKLSFYIICVEAKKTRQPHREPCSHSTTTGFRLHADVGDRGDTFATF